jgi:uncharacterized protein YdhG (YjbR/CyaY superfamily)
MAAGKKRPKTVDEYVANAPKEAQRKLREMRATLKKAAPGATEAIKWGSPTFSYTRILFAYAAFKNHMSLMPTPSVIRALKKDLAKYKTTAGGIQFPYDAPLPKALITKVAKLRVKQLKENDVRWM